MSGTSSRHWDSNARPFDSDIKYSCDFLRIRPLELKDLKDWKTLTRKQQNLVSAWKYTTLVFNGLALKRKRTRFMLLLEKNILWYSWIQVMHSDENCLPFQKSCLRVSPASNQALQTIQTLAQCWLRCLITFTWGAATKLEFLTSATCQEKPF